MFFFLQYVNKIFPTRSTHPGQFKKDRKFGIEQRSPLRFLNLGAVVNLPAVPPMILQDDALQCRVIITRTNL